MLTHLNKENYPSGQVKTRPLNPDYAYPWQPDCANGTYCNPIIFADYSDPDVIRAGEDFYLTASSFNCTPGLPILHSKDLVNWRIVNHAIKNLPHPRYAAVQPGCGVWAPAMRYHAGKYWIFFSMPDEGIYLTTADDPTGKWSEPHLVQEGRGLIDPCPLWDDDGQAYLVHAYANSRSGIKHKLRVCPMAADGLRLLGEGAIIFDDPKRHPTLEGPKFFKKDGCYYILAPAGGVETGWQVALRSKNVFGPYEDRIVLHQGKTIVNGPHQGALVDLPNGENWFIHFQDAGVYGRITHLQPVRWQDGWPLMGTEPDEKGIGQPVLQYPKPEGLANGLCVIPQTSDDFDSSKLGLQWQWHANHRDDWYSLDARKGWLRLYSQPAGNKDLREMPNLLMQKFPARMFSVETMLDFAGGQPGEGGGLVISGQACATFALEIDKTGRRIVLRINGEEKFARPYTAHSVKFQVSVREGGLCHFSLTDGDSIIRIPQSLAAQKGIWIGAKIGLYSCKRLENGQSGYMDADYFRFA